MQVRSLSSGKTHSTHVPVKGPLSVWPLCTGYLLVQKDKHSFSLINPFINREDPFAYSIFRFIHKFRPVCYDQGKDRVVILQASVENTHQRIVCFCRPDDEAWKITELPYLGRVFYCLYYNGRCLFLHDYVNDVLSVDAITGSILFRLPVSSIDTNSTFSFSDSPLGPIVEFFGHVLVVLLILDDDRNAKSLEIYRLELLDDSPDRSARVKTSNIGDNRMLFFDYQGNCISARTSDSSRLKKGNSMYFIEWCLFFFRNT